MFVTRTEWGSVATRRTIVTDALPELYIHHTGAGSVPPDAAGEMALMRNLQAFAIRPVAAGGKGYSDLDYNLLVGNITGNIYEGRGIDFGSIATLDRNQISRSICLIGNYQTATPTDQALDAIINAGRMMIAAGRLAPDVIVRGHRDNPSHPGATACPGNHLYEFVSELAAGIAQYTPTPDPQPQLEDNDMVYITNGSTIWALLDDGTKRELGYPVEYELRGSPVGTKITAEQLAQIPDHR